MLVISVLEQFLGEKQNSGRVWTWLSSMQELLAAKGDASAEKQKQCKPVVLTSKRGL